MHRKRITSVLFASSIIVLLGTLLFFLRSVRPPARLATNQAMRGAVATANEALPEIASTPITLTQGSLMAVFIPATGSPPPTYTSIPTDATPTPTWDPLATPQPTYQDEAPYEQLFPNPIPNNDAEATLQFPTPTPIQTISPANNSRYSAQNVHFVEDQSSIPLQLQQPDSFTDFAWSPDSTLLAASLITGHIEIHSPAISGTIHSPVTKIVLFDRTGQQVTDLGRGGSILWSPTSQWIAYQYWEASTASAILAITDIHTGATSVVPALGKNDTYTYAAWISDTELLYFRQGLFVFDVHTGQQRKFLTDEMFNTLFVDPGYTLSAVPSALPRLGLVAVSGVKTLAVFHYDRLATRLLYQFPPADMAPPSFSPNGRELAYIAARTRQLTIVSLTDSGRPAISISNQREVSPPFAWSPDGSSLVYGTIDGLYIVNRDGSGLRPISGVKEVPNILSWSIDGILSWTSGDGLLVDLRPVNIETSSDIPYWPTSTPLPPISLDNHREFAS